MEASSKANIEDATTDTNTSVDSSVSSDAEEMFSEEETKKAEEFKVMGNEAFKSKSVPLNLTIAHRRKLRQSY
jgi:hypothetical protein